MRGLVGYNCHLDEEHVKHVEINDEDMKTFIGYCEYFKIKVPEHIMTLLLNANDSASYHAAAHEFMDWMLTEFLDNENADPQIVDTVRTFTHYTDKLKAKEKAIEHRNKLRTECIRNINEA